MNSLGVDVILKDVKDHPRCIHGPTLLFERFSCGKKSGRQYYACSACRDRKDCNFFQWASEDVKKLSSALIENTKLPLRLKSVKTIKMIKRRFCKDCSQFVKQNEFSTHINHEIIEPITDEMMSKPTTLLQPLTSSKKEAQYFFTNKTVKFFILTIKRLGFNKVLNIGCPRIHEHILQHEPSLQSLLLDIDQRYEQFFEESEFCWYNVFNHHFFRGSMDKQVYKNFICCGEEDKIIVLMDPPFGGLIDALAYTFKILCKDWKKRNNGTQEYLPLFWVFPYFMEKRLVANLPLTMLDYKVDYTNHAFFREGSKIKSGSPIKIFTNIDASQIVLPAEEGYRFCEICQRYVANTNVHCMICGTCTSKDGKTYIHCTKCNQCMKPSRIHCDICNICLPPNHSCGKPLSLIGCHICGDLSHKRIDCPSRDKKSQKLKSKARRRRKITPY